MILISFFVMRKLNKGRYKMPKSNYLNDFYKQFEELNQKLDKLLKENKKQTITIYNQKLTIDKLNEELSKANKKIEELLLEIERLKNNNNKNSSNSSKPSSTNGFKKVITNNRNKSTKKQGGQPNHKGKTLTNEKIEKMIENNEIDEIITIEENKTERNKNLTPIIRYEYDIKIKRIVTKHIIYPNKTTNITSYPVIYGNNIKILNCILGQKYMSLDGIQKFIYDTTNNNLLTSKGSFYAWNKEIYKLLLDTEYKYIQKELMNALVLHVDESPIKINGEQYYLHNISDGKHTLQYVTKHRSKDDIEEFGFLKKYKGIIVHDHYKIYYNYGTDNAECNVHILRYLNAVSEFTNHTWAKELKSLLLEMKVFKENNMSKDINDISEEEYNKFKNKYLDILNEGKKERLKDLNKNAYKKEELNLLNRLIKYVDNHLLFLKKFFVPFSNNQAEADLRGIKIKQKIGKFRSIEGANIYAVIKSCMSTYNKNGINLYLALDSLFTDNPILI